MHDGRVVWAEEVEAADLMIAAICMRRLPCKTTVLSQQAWKGTLLYGDIAQAFTRALDVGILGHVPLLDRIGRFISSSGLRAFKSIASFNLRLSCWTCFSNSSLNDGLLSLLV